MSAPTRDEIIRQRAFALSVMLETIMSLFPLLRFMEVSMGTLTIPLVRLAVSARNDLPPYPFVTAVPPGALSEYFSQQYMRDSAMQATVGRYEKMMNLDPRMYAIAVADPYGVSWWVAYEGDSNVTLEHEHFTSAVESEKLSSLIIPPTRTNKDVNL